MTMTDPIADLLTRIRNGQQAGHQTVTLDTSTLKLSILAILKDEGYIAGFTEKEQPDSPRNLIEIALKYDRAGKPAIREIKRESTPGRRKYVHVHEIPFVMSGLGVAVVSTSKGVLPDHKARQENVGGELICTVW